MDPNFKFFCARHLIDCSIYSLVSLLQKKRFLIHLKGQLEAYVEREIYDILWIHYEKNPADGRTKRGSYTALKELMKIFMLDADRKVSIKGNMKWKYNTETQKTWNIPSIWKQDWLT